MASSDDEAARQAVFAAHFPGHVTPLSEIGPKPGTFGGDFLRQLVIAVGVSVAVTWIFERSRAKNANERFVVVSDREFERLRGRTDEPKRGDTRDDDDDDIDDDIEADARALRAARRLRV